MKLSRTSVGVMGKGMSFSQRHPTAIKRTKIALLTVAIVAVAALAIALIVHYTCGWTQVGQWIHQSALPAVNQLLQKHITVGQGLLYFAVPILGVGALGLLGYKLKGRAKTINHLNNIRGN